MSHHQCVPSWRFSPIFLNFSFTHLNFIIGFLTIHSDYFSHHHHMLLVISQVILEYLLIFRYNHNRHIRLNRSLYKILHLAHAIHFAEFDFFLSACCTSANAPRIAVPSNTVVRSWLPLACCIFAKWKDSEKIFGLKKKHKYIFENLVKGNSNRWVMTMNL